MKQSKINDSISLEIETSNEIQFHLLLLRFSSLIKYVRLLILPSWRKGISKAQKMSEWSKLRKILYTISSPSFASHIDEWHFYDLLIFFCWIFSSIFWYGIAQYATRKLLGLPIEETSNGTLPILLYSFGLFILIIASILILASIWRWVEFFRDNRYHTIFKVLIPLGFLTILGVGAIYAPFWLLPSTVQESYSQFANINIWVVPYLSVYIFTIFPFITFYLFLLIEMIILSLHMLWGGYYYLRVVNNPNISPHIETLILHPIKVIDNNKNLIEWNMLSISQKEIETILEWSRANREGTDKRLLPLAIFIAGIGLFANTQIFNNVITSTILWISKSLSIFFRSSSSLLEVGNSIIAFAIILLILDLMDDIVLIFQNLIIYGVIIEACVVAKYVLSHKEDVLLQHLKEYKGISFWARIMKIFQDFLCG